jgi:DNA replication protein DnaC
MTDLPKRVGELRAVWDATRRQDSPVQAVSDGSGIDGADGRRVRLERLWAGLIPGRFQDARLEELACEPATIATLRDWAESPAGRNLMLVGPIGVGKTIAAIAAVRPLHDAGRSVRFVPLVELFDELRPDGPPGALARTVSVDVLVIDDLGSEKATDWTAERLYALVNRRWLEERPTVATTDLEPDLLKATIGERTYSRLVGNDAVAVRLSGPDRRRTR